MSIRRELGQGVAWTRSDSAYCVHPSQYLCLKDAWMRGQAFFEGTSLNGAHIVIKLATVEAIMLQTPESIREGERNDEEERNEDMLAGRT